MCDWSLPFDESMLDKHVVILCKTEEASKSLFKILQRRGTKWAGGEPLTPDNTYFREDGDYKHGMCYHMTPVGLRRGPIRVAENYSEWRGYIKCTFNGVQLDDFNVSNTTSLF